MFLIRDMLYMALLTGVAEGLTNREEHGEERRSQHMLE